MGQVTFETKRQEEDGARTELELSDHELAALACAALGLTSEESGRRLCKSAETVKAQLGSARVKLGARNTTHAVSIAIRRRLLEPSS
jgi:DNA-binding CsgD family transcriptional regulator